MTAEQLTLLSYATAELEKAQRPSSLGLKPRRMTTKSAICEGIPESALRRAKKLSCLDYNLPHGKGRVRIKFIEQVNHRDYWRIWEYEEGGN
jgi:hypothetical protein